MPGELVGSLVVRTRPGVDREGVLASARAALTPLVSDLTVHLEPAAALPLFKLPANPSVGGWAVQSGETTVGSGSAPVEHIAKML